MSATLAAGLTLALAAPIAAMGADQGARTSDRAVQDQASAPLDPTQDAPAMPSDVAAEMDPDNRKVARVVTNAAWSWFMDPRVLNTGKQTYLSSVNNLGDIQVTAVRNSDARLTHTTLAPNWMADDHTAPALAQTPDGRIIAAWAGHGDTGPVRYRITAPNGDVSTMGETRKLTGSGLEDMPATYTSILQLSESNYRYWLFTRRQSDRSWVVTRSNDLLTWTKAVRLWTPPHDPTDEFGTPYPKFVTDGRGRIDMAVTDSQQTNRLKTSVYHFRYEAGWFWTSDGNRIQSFGDLGRGSMDIASGTKIYDGASADGAVRMYDIALDGTNPVVVVNTRAASDFSYKWARWNGSHWELRTLRRNNDPFGQPGGITFDHQDPTTVYLVRDQQATGMREVEQWRTTDAGQTWSTRSITAASVEANRTPAAPWGTAGGPIGVAWLNGTYEAFNGGRYWTSAWVETTGYRPVSLSARWSSTWFDKSWIDVTAQQGVRGVGAQDVRVAAAVKRPGGTTYSVVDRVNTDTNGVARLRLPDVPKGTWVRVYTYKANGWGYASVPSEQAPR